MQEALNIRPLKKRHTKPCKFYQTMSCPLPADVCDFAHILANPIIAARPDNLCRYYQAGFCANGTWCQYAHSIEASPALSDAVNGLQISDRNRERVRSLSSANHDAHITTNGVMRQPAVISVHAPSVAAAPNAASGPPHRGANLPFKSRAGPSLTKTKSFSCLMPRRSSATMALPVYHELNDSVVVRTEDPRMGEHPHSHQSRVYVADASSPMHAPPYPSPPHPRLSIGPVSPQFQLPSPLYVLDPKFLQFPPPPKKPKPRRYSKKKLEKYKTKPCKFFGIHGMCPNGDACTFIHDEDPQSTKGCFLNKNSDDIDERDSDSSEVSSESAKLSSVPTEQTTDQDCCRVGAIMISTGSGYSSLRDPHAGDKGCSQLDETEKKTRRRARTNSIPTRPTQLGMENLFSAESPAVL